MSRRRRSLSVDGEWFRLQRAPQISSLVKVREPTFVCLWEGLSSIDIGKHLATRQDLFPRTPYLGSLHDYWWEGLFSTAIYRRCRFLGTDRRMHVFMPS